MRILGIDPGLAIVGWGVIDYNGNKFSVVDYGAVLTQAHTEVKHRLKIIYENGGNNLRPMMMLSSSEKIYVCFWQAQAI